jgi:hypothetical protein
MAVIADIKLDKLGSGCNHNRYHAGFIKAIGVFDNIVQGFNNAGFQLMGVKLGKGKMRTDAIYGKPHHKDIFKIRLNGEYDAPLGHALLLWNNLLRAARANKTKGL